MASRCPSSVVYHGVYHGWTAGGRIDGLSMLGRVALVVHETFSRMQLGLTYGVYSLSVLDSSGGQGLVYSTVANRSSRCSHVMTYQGLVVAGRSLLDGCR